MHPVKILSYNDTVTKVAIGIPIILLPMLYQLDFCFYELTASTFLFAFLSLTLISVIIFQKNYLWRKNDIFVGLFFIWEVVRYLFSSVPNDIFSLYDIVSMALVYVWIRNTSSANAIFPALFVGGIIQSFWGILQFAGILPSYHAYFGQTGCFNNPALWGIYSAMSFFCGMRLLQTQTRGVYKILTLAGTGITLTGIALAHSRAAWLALACSSAWVLLEPMRNFVSKKWNKKYTIATIVILVLLLFALWGIYLIRPDSVKGRLLIYTVSFSMFRSAPWFGHGIASFAAEYMNHQASWFLSHPKSAFAIVAGNNHSAFNECTKIACEQGIIGLALFSLLVFHSIRTINTETRYPTGLSVMIFIFGMFSYPFEDVAVRYIFYFTVASMSNRTKIIGQITKVPRWMRYLASLILLVNVITIGMEYWFCKTVENDLQKVTQEKLSILAPCFVRYYQKLNTSPDFVSHYAEELYAKNYYREAIPVLNQIKELQCNELVLIALGTCYQQEGEYDKATEAFQLASRMTPAYILPRFHLFSLYQETGKMKEARQVAIEALSMQVKIVNTTVLRARHTMRTYLDQIEKK